MEGGREKDGKERGCRSFNAIYDLLLISCWPDKRETIGARRKKNIEDRTRSRETRESEKRQKFIRRMRKRHRMQKLFILCGSQLGPETLFVSALFVSKRSCLSFSLFPFFSDHYFPFLSFFLSSFHPSICRRIAAVSGSS